MLKAPFNFVALVSQLYSLMELHILSAGSVSTKAFVRKLLTMGYHANGKLGRDVCKKLLKKTDLLLC